MENKSNQEQSENQYTQGQISMFIIINIILLGLISYASTNLTLGFFGAIGEGQVQQSNWLTGLVNDACKIFLPLLIGIAVFKKKYFHATFIILVICGNMYISYLASQGLDLNNSNKELIAGSSKQELVDAKAEKTKELTKLEKKEEALTAPIKAQIEALPNDYISAKAKLQKNITGITNQYIALTKPVQKKIDDYNTKIENYKVDTTLTTSGYHALAKFTGMAVGTITKWKNIFMEILSFLLSINLGMLLAERTTGIFSKFTNAVGNFRRSKKKPPVEKNTPETTDDSSIDYEIPQNANGGISLEKTQGSAYKETESTLDNTMPCDYSREDIEEYLMYVYKTTATGKSCNGQNLIRDNTNLSLEQIKAIRYHLKRLGIVEINNKTNRTFLINESIEDALKLI